MKHSIIQITIFFFLVLSFSSCSFILLCQLTYDDFNESYDFNCSKEALKDRIVAAYTYKDHPPHRIGTTTIGNEQIDTTRQRTSNFRLTKKNWAQFKPEIRANMSDTIGISINKGLKAIKFTAIVSGNDKNSRLTIQTLKYIRRRECKKEPAFYQKEAAKRIQKRFIKKLR